MRLCHVACFREGPLWAVKRINYQHVWSSSGYLVSMKCRLEVRVCHVACFFGYAIYGKFCEVIIVMSGVVVNFWSVSEVVSK